MGQLDRGGSPPATRLPVGVLDGRTVMVTGASSGLGRACATAVVTAGGNVLAVDRDRARLASLQQANAERIEACVADVTSSRELDGAVEAAVSRFGRLDGLVACAGIPGEGTALEVSEERWAEVLGVNLTGVWLSARAVLPRLIDQGSGSIVLISSITALVGRPGVAAYAAAKGGVCALARQIAYDVARHNVRVNSICPGTVLTAMAQSAYEERGVINPVDRQAGIDALGAAYPLGRLGELADVSDALIFLLGDGASWITGATLPVDGGLTALDAPRY